MTPATSALARRALRTVPPPKPLPTTTVEASPRPDGLTFAAYLAGIVHAPDPVTAANLALEALLRGAPESLVACRMVDRSLTAAARRNPGERAL